MIPAPPNDAQPAVAAEEWRYLRVAFALVALLVLAEIAGWLVYREVHHETPPLALTKKCLVREKLLAVDSVGNDMIARSASRGTLATRVEGSGVHVLIGSSDDEAERLAGYYRTVAHEELVGRLDLRGHVLYFWEGVATPTQRQTMYDCWYQ